MSTETENLRRKQIDADQAWEYLQSKGVPNLDIERPGKDKVTLVELLAEFANGVYIGRDETDYEEVAERVRMYAESWAGQPHSADPWPWDNFQVGRIIQWAVLNPQTKAPTKGGGELKWSALTAGIQRNGTTDLE